MFDIKLEKSGVRTRVAGLPGCAEALAIARLARRRRVVVVTSDTAAAARMAEQLRCVMDPAQVVHLVGWEVLPYDTTSPSRSVASERIAALVRLRRGFGQHEVFVTSGPEAMLPCAAPDALAGQAFDLAVGASVDVQRLARDLAAGGCASVDRVRAAGEFAIYGGQVDIYPGGGDHPFRLVLDMDRIAQVRSFDPASQLSTGQLEGVRIMPAREYRLDEEAVTDFRLRWRARFEGAGEDRLYERISAGEEADGAEFLLPLFYGKRYGLFDYLSGRDVLWYREGLQESLEHYTELVRERYSLALSAGHAALPPEEVFSDAEGFFRQVGGRQAVEVRQETGPGVMDMGARPLPAIAARRASAKPYAQLAKWAAGTPGRVVYAWSGEARRLRVESALKAAQIAAAATDVVAKRRKGSFLFDGPLTGGFWCERERFGVVTEAELHGYVPAPQLKRSAAGAAAVLDDLTPGDLVVHMEHGVARYRGLAPVEVDGVEEEFVHLEFADDVKLYVAVAHCHLLSRYRRPEADEQVALHKLGGSRWKRLRSRAEKAARDTAVQLLDLYAKRASGKGRAPARIDEEGYAAFCAAFTHADTVDQTRASAEVANDLSSPRPMDRLICGDVGFGKTEVAMRAAWIAWSSGRQVAVVAPTTLLANQLHRGFVERFAGTRAVVGELSSLHGPQASAEARELLAKGELDIVVGTHALFSSGLKIPKLGLVIIDEEHRFGVRQKERLREMRAKVDVLALSATPIPRTLSMALEGLRDLSLIATPPSERLAVRTLVSPDSDSIVREALARELARGGQVFFVHHRVQTINTAVERVRDLAPEAQIDVVHGQMPPAKRETAMEKFYNGEVDVLVCTTIVESGIDVPNANTIVIPRSDLLGLADMHQLRGRVGRSTRQGYAYLMVPPTSTAGGKAAARRLEIMAETSQLGGGYQIAVRDLEIRGAGEILGEAQSGVVVAVGIETFKHLLAAAVREVKTGAPVPDCEIDLGGHARLPSNYCASPVERMRMYRRLADAASDDELEQLRQMLVDRFGPVPAAARLLLESHHLRLLGPQLGVAKIQLVQRGAKFQFVADAPSAAAVLELVAQRSDLRLDPDQSLRLDCAGDIHERLAGAAGLCNALQAKVQEGE